MNTLVVTQYKYLKTPKWKWTITNDQGGSFSNSGEYGTLKKLWSAFRAQHSGPEWLECEVRLVFLEGYDPLDNAIETVYETTYRKVFGDT